MTILRTAAGALAVALAVIGLGCESHTASDVYGIPRDQARLSLYARMGGEAGMRGLVDDLLWRVQADPRVNFAGQGTGRPWVPTAEQEAKVRAGFVHYFGELTGGPQVYRGPTMVSLHAGRQITNAEFDAFLDDTSQSLRAVGIGEPERSEFLAMLSPLRNQIVESPSETPPRRTASPVGPRQLEAPPRR